MREKIFLKSRLKAVKTFTESQRKDYEEWGHYEDSEGKVIAHMRVSKEKPKVILTVPRRHGWNLKRREIVLVFNVIMQMTTQVERGQAVITFQRSFSVTFINTSYNHISRRAKEIVKRVEKDAKRTFPKASILGSYLTQVMIGKRTNRKFDWKDVVAGTNHDKRKLLRDAT